MSLIPATHRWARLAASGCTLAFAALAALPAAAQDAPVRKAFRVCQDPNNLPFANIKGEGYENRIAELFARDLGLKVEYYSFPQRHPGFIRNTLRYKLPNQDYPCDIVMNWPVGSGPVMSTKAYYHSTHALVIPQGRGLDDVRSPQDLLQLESGRRAKLRIGLYDRSPASQWLVKHEMVDNGVPYPIMNANPDHYPGLIIERDLAEGRLDAVIVWGPLAGYFANRVKQPAMRVLPMQSEPGVRFDYPMAMGVRHGEGEWKQQIEALIDKHGPQIQAILKEYGVPLIDDPVIAAGTPK